MKISTKKIKNQATRKFNKFLLAITKLASNLLVFSFVLSFLFSSIPLSLFNAKKAEASHFALVAETVKTSRDSGDFYDKTYNLSVTPTSGNMLVVLWMGISNGPISSISGGGVSTWTKAISDTGTYTAEIWYGLNSDGSSGSITVHTGGSTGEQINVLEVSRTGGTAGATVEASTAGTNERNSTGTTVRSNAITPTAGLEAVMFSAWARNGSATHSSGPGGGFTAISGGTNAKNGGYQFVDSTTGSYEYTDTWTNTFATHTAVIAAITWPVASNNRPIISSVTDSPDPAGIGEEITFSVNWNDSDAEGVKTYICKGSATSTSGCDGSGTWASYTSTYDTTDPKTVTYTATASDVATSPNIYYAFVCDDEGDHSSCSDATSGTFTVEVPDIDQLHYRWRTDNGSEVSATYPLAEDTPVTSNLFIGDRVRLRFLLLNRGGSAVDYSFRLEHSSSSCTTWMPVPTSETDNTHWIMGLSSYLEDGSVTTNSGNVSDPSGGSVDHYYRTITIDHTKVSSNQTNFPVLVSGTYSYLKTTGNGGKVQNANGYDIEFASDTNGSSLLDWEVEKYDSSTGEIVAWVSIPSLSSSSDTTFYLLYGDSSINSDQSNPTGVWDSNYKAVYHLNQDPSVAGSGGIIDSTSNNADGTDQGSMDASDRVSGRAGYGLDFDGSNDYIQGTDIDFASAPFTVSAWFKTSNSSQSYPRIVSKWGSFSSVNWETILDTGNYPSSGLYDGSNYPYSTDDVDRTDGSWHYLSMVVDSSNITQYVDGSADSAASHDNSFPTNNASFEIAGATAINGTSGFFAGQVDEVRISNTNRSSGWITTEYNNQNSTSTFYSLGSEQSVITGGPTFVDGYYVERPNNSSTAFTLDTDEFTELEYTIRSTAYVSVGTTYCFRLTNAEDASEFTYTQTPQAVVSDVIIRPSAGGNSIGGEGNGVGPIRSGGGTSAPGGSLEGTGSGPSQGGGGPGGGGGGDLGFILPHYFKNFVASVGNTFSRLAFIVSAFD